MARGAWQDTMHKDRLYKMNYRLLRNVRRTVGTDILMPDSVILIVSV